VIELKNITASYGENLVLQDFSLSVAGGELVALLGASGCGKTTALKVVAGLMTENSGEVWLDGKNITKVSAERREAAMVFQKPLLFPFLNVAENVGFGLKMRHLPKSESRQKVAEALSLVKLEGFEKRSAKQLSGGQEQRVALARALVTNPRVLLLDEPFSALDAGLRIEMRNLVRELQQRSKITTVFVTHDQEEAVSIADRIALMDNGKLAQISAPKDFFINPSTPNVARFFGWKLFDGKVRADFIETSIGKFGLFETPKKLATGDKVLIGFHPTWAQIGSPEITNFDKNYVVGKLEQIINLGAKLRVTASLSNGELLEVEIIDSPTISFLVNAERRTNLKFIIPSHSLIIFL
jgi:ABC-type Fe3+/spermidine/putrescine transport system ATPase subunit